MKHLDPTVVKVHFGEFHDVIMKRNAGAMHTVIFEDILTGEKEVKRFFKKEKAEKLFAEKVTVSKAESR